MDKNIVTYSRSATVNLSRICSCLCDYCDYPTNNLDQNQFELVIPYLTIKLCNQAKKAGAKEVMFVAGERPDNFSAVRARLDLWGFNSYIEYVYTVCELIFLEGLLPSLNIGYLSKEEILGSHDETGWNGIRRIASAIYMMLDCADEKILEKYSPRKTLQSRVDTISYAGVGKVPITTGILVGLGESDKSRREAMEIIKALHQEYGNIQNVVLQNYRPIGNPKFEIKSQTKKDELLRVCEMARRILPDDVPITIPAVSTENILPFINAGVRDIGSFDVLTEKKSGLNYNELLGDLEKSLKKKGLGLQRRLPIFSKYIIDNWYSRKLAQVLDRYKALLKGSEDPDLSAETDSAFAEEFASIVPRQRKKKKTVRKAKPHPVKKTKGGKSRKR
ncbi:7,8-didemethyl-8-hydroxy-5-deazariboflavin synthase subunit CofG [Candidatus Termititenax persephonae]|uniref:7,8-didemethyl-8-hydroxy-5-deazariboflavin synthase n=1 Tax=Candidatus Termititenax persephonae TaxID=2218525 RepID=A0A388TFE4_9BACT|nr:7,8-didemethyl-8-hydroxy-5-deazariboflavin synthase subunit CofG [Candidatus Termititenax persephonae]